MSNRKVLYVITGLETGGAERSLLNLLYGGLSKNFDCKVVSLSGFGDIGPQIDSIGVPVVALKMSVGAKAASALAALRSEISAFGPSIVHGWMYHGNFAATLALKLRRSRPVLAWGIRQTLYDISDEKPMTRHVIRANRYFSRMPDALIYNSRLSRRQHEEFGFAVATGCVIPNGIDTDQYRRSAERRQRVRTELGIANDTFVVGHVARNHPMKNHAGFIKAAVTLSGEHDGVHFLLAGCNVSDRNSRMVKMVPNELRDRFHFLGQRTDIAALMNAMDAFCLTSKWGEGFPNVIGEAMASGLPCVTTDVGDAASIVGDTGSVVSPGDKSALMNAIKSLLFTPIVERQHMGSEARRRIEKHFTLNCVVDQYSSTYDDLLISKKGR